MFRITDTDLRVVSKAGRCHLDISVRVSKGEGLEKLTRREIEVTGNALMNKRLHRYHTILPLGE